ncbi:MAG: hypothetical protein AAGA85_09570 [Bacteroidota bacterium]
MRTSRSLASYLLLFIIVSACTTQPEEKDETEIQYSPEIARIINYATSGSILPESTIEIQFNDAVVAEDALNQEIVSPIQFEPAIGGKAYWATNSRLVFEPEQSLASRINYQGKVDLKLLKESFEVETFEFKFYVDGRELVSFNGELDLLNPANPQDLVYRGKVTFSQETSLEDVQGAASFSSADLNWSQEGDKAFSFVSGKLTRGSSAKDYQFKLDADRLDLEENLERTVKVVPLKSMDLVELERDESGKKPQVMLKFSDELDKDQNIDGFVSVSPSVPFTAQKMGRFLVLNGDFKFGTKYSLRIQSGLKSKWGTQTEANISREVTFSDIQPQVQFASRGIYMPTPN